MRIKTNIPLKNFSGQTLKGDDGTGNAVDSTIKMVLINALLSPVQNEVGIKKMEKYNLAQKIYNSDEVELTAEEITLIKERVGEGFPPLVVGQVYELLEGKTGDS